MSFSKCPFFIESGHNGGSCIGMDCAWNTGKACGIGEIPTLIDKLDAIEKLLEEKE